MPLAARGRYITLLQGFCPLCFRGRIGESNGERFLADDPRVDQDQLCHSKKLNGIPPLDFKSMGGACLDGDMCNVNCLVCGKAVFRGGSGAYKLFRHMIQPEQDERVPKAMRAFDEIGNGVRFREALKAHDAVMVDNWDTPIHRACSYPAPCKCVLPLDCTVCKRHRAREDFRWSKQAASYKAECESSKVMVEDCAPMLDTLSGSRDDPAKGAAGAPGSSWSGFKVKGAVITGKLPVLKEEEVSPLCAPLLPKPKVASKKPIPLPPGNRTLDAWMACPREPAPALLDVSCPGFDFYQHSRAFDESKHGYVATKDGVYYRFPDGRFVKAYSSVSTIVEGGVLVPSGSDTIMQAP